MRDSGSYSPKRTRNKVKHKCENEAEHWGDVSLGDRQAFEAQFKYDRETLTLLIESVDESAGQSLSLSRKMCLQERLLEANELLRKYCDEDMFQQDFPGLGKVSFDTRHRSLQDSLRKFENVRKGFIEDDSDDCVKWNRMLRKYRRGLRGIPPTESMELTAVVEAMSEEERESHVEPKLELRQIPQLGKGS